MTSSPAGAARGFYERHRQVADRYPFDWPASLTDVSNQRISVPVDGRLLRASRTTVGYCVLRTTVGYCVRPARRSATACVPHDGRLLRAPHDGRLLRASRTTVGYCVLRTTVGYCVLRTTVGYCVLRTTVGYCVLRTTVGYCVLRTTVGYCVLPHDGGAAGPSRQLRSGRGERPPATLRFSAHQPGLADQHLDPAGVRHVADPLRHPGMHPA